MVANKRVSKNNPVKDITTVNDQVFFTYEGVKYSVDKIYDSSLFRESDNLSSVRYDKDKNCHVITTQADFGGLGLDAIKKCIVPFQSWLDSKCHVHYEEKK
jgi:hypothetical protein